MQLEHNLQNKKTFLPPLLSKNESKYIPITMENQLSKVLAELRKEFGEIYPLPGFETIRKLKTNNVMHGLKYVFDDGFGIRFNWVKQDKNLPIFSVDFFVPERLFENPYMCIVLNDETLEELLPMIVDIQRKAKMNYVPPVDL